MDKNIFTGKGSSDPFIKIKVGSESAETTVKKKELEPVWNERFNMEADKHCPSILFEMDDHDIARLVVGEYTATTSCYFLLLPASSARV